MLAARGWRSVWSTAAIAAVALGGCSLTTYKTGTLVCGAGGLCPTGLSCGCDGFCVTGTLPSCDAGSSQGSSGTASTGSGSQGSTSRGSTSTGGSSTLATTGGTTGGTTPGASSKGGSSTAGATSSSTATSSTASSTAASSATSTAASATTGTGSSSTGGSSSGGHTPQFVQDSENEDFSGNSDAQQIVTLPGSVAAGDLLLVGVNYTLVNQASSAGETITVTDSLGNPFVEIADDFDPNSNAYCGLRTFYATGVTGGVDQLLVSMQPACTQLAVYVAEYAGLSSVVADTELVQIGVSTQTDDDAVGLTTDGGGTLVWALSAIATNVAQAPMLAGTGFTPRGPDAGSWPISSGGVFGRAEDAPPHAAATQIATWTLSTTTDTVNAIVLLR
jgi:hypothetical protein